MSRPEFPEGFFDEDVEPGNESAKHEGDPLSGLLYGVGVACAVGGIGLGGWVASGGNVVSGVAIGVSGILSAVLCGVLAVILERLDRIEKSIKG